MKRLAYLLFLTLVLASCGTDGQHFKFEGRLLNLNQGELYLYSPDGVFDGLDTIGIKNGRFSFETRCEKPGIIVIVFPNFSEQPVFAQPGKTAEIKGDATHLKDLTVKGTKENKQMNTFREQISMASPPEIQKAAGLFIEDNPGSVVSNYLLTKYFIRTPRADYKRAHMLLQQMITAQPDNQELKKLSAKIRNADAAVEGKQLASFSALDIFGNRVSSSAYTSGLAVIYLWASWDYESCAFQRAVRDLRDNDNVSIQALGISIDLSDVDCFRTVDTDGIKFPIVREDGLFEGKLLSKIGLNTFPDNILLRNGKIIARNVNVGELRQKVKE